MHCQIGFLVFSVNRELCVSLQDLLDKPQDLLIELAFVAGVQDEVHIYLVVPILADLADDPVDVHLLSNNGQNDEQATWAGASKHGDRKRPCRWF